MNPAIFLKAMEAKNRFESNHPKFAQFVGDMLGSGVEEGSVIDVKITRPDGTVVSTNMKVQASDLEMLQYLKEMI